MATFDQVDAWFYRDGRLLQRHQAGDSRPFTIRPLADARFAFPVPPGNDVIALLRVRTGGFLNLRPLWLTSSDYLGNLSARSAWYGVFFGGLAIMALYNFFVFLSLRDTNFLLYSGYVISLALFLSVFTGHAAQFLWPESGDLSNTMMVSATCLSVMFGLAFCLGFLRAATFPPIIDRAAKALFGFAGLLIALALAGASYELLIRATTILGYLALSTYLLLALSAWHAGVREARFLLLAFSCFAIGMVIHQLHLMGLVSSTIITAHASEFGALLEATLLSFALADRINLLNAENRRLEQEALQAQRTFSRQLVNTQERECEEISRALHDSVGHGLLVIKNYLERAGAGGSTGARNTDSHDQQMAVQCSEMLNTVRDLSHALHPHILQRLDLARALESILDRSLASTDIQGSCCVEDCDECLEPDARLALYRVAQEALSNAIKHAQASEIILDVRREGRQVVMRVKDDGQGFDPGSTSSGLGLVNMRGRMQLVGGRLELTTVPGSGCELRCEVPVNPACS